VARTQPASIGPAEEDVLAATNKPLDPITFAVVRAGFDHITRLMSTNLQRTSYSPILYDMVDFSNALFDPAAQLVGQTTNVPVHLASMHFSVQASLDAFPEGLDEGDVVLLNDPYQGGTHIPDVTFTMPIVVDGETIGFAASRGHWLDLGGAAPGGMVANATHIVQEGLRIPPVKIYERGILDEKVHAILKANTRVPHYIDGDLRAHLSALRTAEQELKTLTGRYGTETVRACMSEALAYTERRTRAAIRAIPDGTYTAEDWIDTDGVSPDSVPIRATLTVDDDEITVDLRASSPLVAGPINYPAAGSHSAVYFALKFFLDPDAPPNAGLYRPITVLLSESGVVNARWPAPVFNGNLSTSERIADVVWQALEEAIPARMVGMTYGDCNSFSVSAHDPETGIPYIADDLPPGGWGGTPFADGMDATYSRHGNCMDLTIEMTELIYPIRFERRELIVDSGGPGAHRGGLGMRQTFAPIEHEAVCGIETSRSKMGPPGVHEGQPGRPGRSLRNYGREDEEVLGGWTPEGEWRICSFSNRPLPRGNTFTNESPGGGGWGDPFVRDPASVLTDVLDGFVSCEGARRDYGVVIVSDGSSPVVDDAATGAERSARRVGSPPDERDAC
jgi:N-methylhydantoinase B/oxoprolinase/acetone carboxylase alpha subunit